MKNIFIQKKLMLGIAIALPTFASSMNVIYDKEKNIVEFIHSLFVSAQPVKDQLPTRGIFVFTPQAPYDHTTFIINLPIAVSVGQTFVVDYTIKNANYTHIPFWADLVPDRDQKSASGLSLINASLPSLGSFNADAASTAQKGGKGIWQFPQGIPSGSVQHLTLTLKATNEGLSQFTTFIATNPPSYLGPISTLVSNNPPVANADNATGSINNAIVISVLDNDTGISPLNVIGVTQAQNGLVTINADNTLLYTPNMGFVGSDSFTYTIQDAGGKSATGSVIVNIISK